MQNFIFALVACTILSAVVRARSSMPDILMDNENAIDSKMMPAKMFSSLVDLGSDNDCYIDVKVTNRVPGKCTLLYGDVKGCVAGQYLDPFHLACASR